MLQFKKTILYCSQNIKLSYVLTDSFDYIRSNQYRSIQFLTGINSKYLSKNQKKAYLISKRKQNNYKLFQMQGNQSFLSRVCYIINITFKCIIIFIIIYFHKPFRGLQKKVLTSSDLSIGCEGHLQIFSKTTRVIINHSHSIAKGFNQWINLQYAIF